MDIERPPPTAAIASLPDGRLLAHFFQRPDKSVIGEVEGPTGQGKAGFVGRDRELALLVEALTAATGEQRQVVLVAGEPGVGKSRLVAELVAAAAKVGVPSCWGRAVEDGSPPLWLFRQVLRSLGPSGTTAEQALAAPRPDTAASEGEFTSEQRFRVFETVTDALIAAARPSGLVVVLDDLHWADAATLQLLSHLVRGSAAARLLVIATYRDTETGGRDGLRKLLAGLAGEQSVTRLRLVGLTEADIGVLLRDLVGRPVSASMSAEISRRTRGNPFFVTELGRLFTGDPGGWGVAALPDGVRDAVRGRLDRAFPAVPPAGRGRRGPRVRPWIPPRSPRRRRRNSTRSSPRWTRPSAPGS